MSQEAYDSLRDRIHKQEQKFGQQPSGREIDKKAGDIARKADAKKKEAERRGR